MSLDSFDIYDSQAVNLEQHLLQIKQIEEEEEKEKAPEVSKRKNPLRLSYNIKIPIPNDLTELQGRRNSLPEQENESKKMRRIITSYVILKVSELGLDTNLAQLILNEKPDEEFIEEHQNRITGDIVECLLQTEVLAPTLERHQSQSYSFKEISIQLRNLLGFGNKNLQDEFQNDQFEQPECPICYSNVNQNNLKTLQCGHYFCDNCVNGYLREKISQPEIFCLSDECHVKLSDEEIKDLGGEIFFEKMIRFRKLKILSENPNIRFCSRPGCELYAHKKNDEKILTCECGQQICFKCGNSAHEGRSCEDALDKTFKHALKEFQIQKCPKCKSPIQKSTGCNHMTCQHCHYEFCWLCRGKYGSRHFDSLNIFGCPDKQYSESKPYAHPWARRFLIIILIMVLILPCLAIGIVGFLLFLPIILMELTYQSYSSFLERDCCYKAVMGPLWVIASIALSPLSLALVLLAIALLPVVGIFYAIYLLYSCCCG